MYIYNHIHTYTTYTYTYIYHIYIYSIYLYTIIYHHMPTNSSWKMLTHTHTTFGYLAIQPSAMNDHFSAIVPPAKCQLEPKL